jgi:hypothetical protein
LPPLPSLPSDIAIGVVGMKSRSVSNSVKGVDLASKMKDCVFDMDQEKIHEPDLH